jgi:hypothetical protein
LPVWQALHSELSGYGFTVITIALDKSAEDPRPFIEAAAPTHPSLIDSEHFVADLYRIINVPTVIWIDAQGRIARPNDVGFGSDMFKELTGVDPQPHLDALRAWVKEDRAPLDDEEIRRRQIVPDPAEQAARAEFSLAWYLHRAGQPAAAEPHFVRAGELAPHDFTIRRGSMPIRGMDPMGPDFADLYAEWVQAGRPYYNRRSFQDD